MTRVSTYFCVAGVIVSTCAVSVAPAQSPVFRSYSRGEGLPSEYILALMQDREGFLWVGTDRGIGRYDGSSFRVFEKQNGLPGNLVYCLFQSGDGTIWAGFHEGGLARLVGDRFESITADIGACFSSVSQISEDGFGASSSSSFRAIAVTGTSIVAATTQSLYHSPDGGTTWRIDTVGMNLPSGFGIGEAKTVYTDGQVVLASVVSTNYIARLYRRLPADTVWSRIDPVSSPRGFAKIGDTLYAAGYYDGLFASTPSRCTAASYMQRRSSEEAMA